MKKAEAEAEVTVCERQWCCCGSFDCYINKFNERCQVSNLSSFSNIALTSSAHLVRMLFGLILIKIIFSYLGPEGLGKLGQFLSFATILALLAGGGIINGVIKFVAEYKDDAKRLQGFMDEAVTYTVFCSVVLCVVCVAFSSPLAVLLFKDSSLYWVFIVVGFLQCGYSFTYLVVGVVNGLKQTRKYALIQIIGSLLSLPVVYYLVDIGGLPGAAIAVVASVFVNIIPAFYVYRKLVVKFTFSFVKLKSFSFGRLPNYSLMLISSAIALPVVEMVVRQWLIQDSGYVGAGLWQGATKLSSAYLGFFSIFLGYVFLPVVSEQDSRDIILRLVIKYMALIAGLFVVGALILYVGRFYFISLLFSDEFSALGNVLVYQLVGDFFKICACVITFVGIAKGATSLYIGAECLQAVLFVGLVYAHESGGDGLKSVLESYAITYALYFFVCCIALYFYVRKQPVANGYTS